MTVSTPLMAPRLPPETGASMKVMPLTLPNAARSRAIWAEVVVWSTHSVPRSIERKPPSGPVATSARSLSLPTQDSTMSAP